MPQESYKLMVDKFEQTKVKLVRLSKINELSFKKRDLEFQNKLKALLDKENLLDSVDREIANFS